jgi:hypothetical protein
LETQKPKSQGGIKLAINNQTWQAFDGDQTQGSTSNPNASGLGPGTHVKMNQDDLNSMSASGKRDDSSSVQDETTVAGSQAPNDHGDQESEIVDDGESLGSEDDARKQIDNVVMF